MTLNSQCRSELERLIPNHLKHVPRKCNRLECGSKNVQMRYFNNHNLNQPRFICNTCKVHFTLGGQTYKTKKKNIVMKRSNVGISKFETRCMETTSSKSISNPRKQQKRRASRRIRSPTIEGSLEKGNSIDMENVEKISQDVSIQALVEETNFVEDDEGYFEEDEVNEKDEEDGDYFPYDEVDEPIEEEDGCYVLEEEDGCYFLEDEVDEHVEDAVDKHVEDAVDKHVEDDVDEHAEDNDESYVLEDEANKSVEEDDDRYIRLEDENDEPIEKDDEDYFPKYEVDEPIEEDGDGYVQEDEVKEPIEEGEGLEINKLANVSETKIQELVLQTKASKKNSMVISTNMLTHDTLSKRKQVMKKATQYLINALTTLEEVYLEKHAMVLHRKCYQVEQARERENRERSKYEETLHSLGNLSMEIVSSWAQYESLTTTRLDKMIAREGDLKMVSQEVEELYSQVKQIDIKHVCHSEVVTIETKANQLWNRVIELTD